MGRFFVCFVGLWGDGGRRSLVFLSFWFLKHRRLSLQYLAPKFTWMNSIAFSNVITPRCQAGGEKCPPSGSKAKIINLIST